jgi:hypothetical protein
VEEPESLAFGTGSIVEPSEKYVPTPEELYDDTIHTYSDFPNPVIKEITVR